jgi:Family of unknown function (DUF5906)
VPVTLEDFVAHLPDHSYIFIPTRATWNATGVNAAVSPVPVLGKNGKPVLNKSGPNKGQPKKVPATGYIDKNRPVHHLTWWPGLPMMIKDQLIIDDAWVKRKGVTTFNLYRPPSIQHGDPKKADRWLDLVHKVYPNDGMRIIRFLAHRVQHPMVKINHALLMGGFPGIGKDTIIVPARRAVGEWNAKNATPTQMFARFNRFFKSVLLVVPEVRDLGDLNRYSFYEHTKICLATPPNTITIDEKHMPEYDVVNCCGIIFTTNHKTDGIYLPADDRRHDVIWSDITKEDFTKDFWTKMYAWYDNGGDTHVAAYLAAHDISKFDPKEPPPKTPAFWAIVDANRAPEEGELLDVIDKLGNPDAFTLEDIKRQALGGDLYEFFEDRRNRRAIPHRLEDANYIPVRNPDADSGLWRINDKRQTVYASSALSAGDQVKAIRKMQRAREQDAKEKKSKQKVAFS